MKMRDITIAKDTLVDKEQLADSYQHFNDKETRKNRAECYISHNNTTIIVLNVEKLNLIIRR